jgi:hypothetical protein
MTSYIAFTNPDGTQTLVEVEKTEVSVAPGTAVKAGLLDQARSAVRVAATTLQDALSSAIRSNAEALYNAVHELSTPPSETEIAFTLKVTGELGNVAVGKTGGEANYTVKLVWKASLSPPK